MHRAMSSRGKGTWGSPWYKCGSVMLESGEEHPGRTARVDAWGPELDDSCSRTRWRLLKGEGTRFLSAKTRVQDEGPREAAWKVDEGPRPDPGPLKLEQVGSSWVEGFEGVEAADPTSSQYRLGWKFLRVVFITSLLRTLRVKPVPRPSSTFQAASKPFVRAV